MLWQILVSARTGLVHTMPHVSSTSDLAAFPLPPLPLRATVYCHRILQAIEHPYQHNQSLMYASSRRWPGTNSLLHHPHLCHNPRASSSLIDVHSRPSHCFPQWMLPIPVLPQREAFLYRDPWPLEYDDDDPIAYEDHLWD